MSVKVTDNTPRVITQQQQGTRVFLRMAAEEIVRVARPKTPKLKGNLRSDVNIIPKGGTSIEVVWNKEYAQYQERGKRRDGSHVVRRYTTGGTGPHFAENAVKEVVKKTSEINIKATRLM